MTKKPWSPLEIKDLLNCRYIAVDPSLSAFGAVFIEVNEGQVYVQEARTLATTQTSDGGWESNFDRAEELYWLILDMLSEWVEPWGISHVVHESPPSGGGTLMRTESSVLAGRELRRAAIGMSLPVDRLVTPQSHKKLLCGNHIAKKKEHHDAIRELLPKIYDGQLITNEALRDALSIGLYAAHRRGEGK